MTAAPSLFISYRRDDHAAVTRLAKRLMARVGTVQLFLDVQDIQPGQSFADVLTAALEAVACVLVVMGPRWVETLQLRARDRRPGASPDFVVLEIAAALQRPVLVIPVLIGGAAMPTPQQLPAEIVALAGRQACVIRDSGFEDDVLQLSDAIAAQLAGR